MYLPLSFAMLGGVLSPSSLKRCPYLSESLNQAIGRLRLLPGSLDELTKFIESTLSSLGLRLCLRLPSRIKDFSFDFDNCATLCRLRYDEMEYALDISYTEPMGTPVEAFYEALLRAEARWLRRSLAERIERLCSDRKARQLLCEVLDEVYATGIRADEMERCGWTPGLCRLMKGALASLYLELTIDFGHLLEPMDYLDYSTLLQAPCYSHPVSPVERLEYEIRQRGNLVKRLLGRKETDVGKRYACALYEELAALLACLPPELARRPGLWEGITVLESFLFFLHSGIPCREEIPYRSLSDPLRMGEMRDELYRDHYSAHQKMREGRIAAQWIEEKMRDVCFGFLKNREEWAHCKSLPRYLYGCLQHRLQVYEEHYGSSFLLAEEKKTMPMPPVPSLASEVPDLQEVHILLIAFGESDDGRGNRLISGQSLNCLERYFIAFLQTRRPEQHYRQIELPNRKKQALYGLFFEYCDTHNGDRELYIDFIRKVFAGAAKDTNLRKNYTHCVNRYKDFVEDRKKLHRPLTTI